MTATEPLQELYKLIRNEEVALFVGAGFSKYAGFPLGGELTRSIHERLPEVLRSRMTTAKALDDYTEELIRKEKGSRDLLNRLLDDIFLMQPLDTADHRLLASIPHFHTIITTNYDTLFEQAYGARANLICNDADIAGWDSKKVNIIKIHGHIADKSSIILTRQDYARFYTQDFSSPFWATIISLIATKNILFLGYGYEDPNIWAIVQKLKSALKEPVKRMFLISPTADDDKIDFLARQGIEYIQGTGTTFLPGLVDEIKEHLVKDLENNITNADTVRLFSRHHNTNLTMESTGTGYRLTSISGIVETDSNWTANMSYRKDSEAMQLIRDFYETNKALELRLSAEQLESFRLAYEGLKLLDHQELAQLVVKKIPRVYEFELAFLTEGWEACGLKADLYLTKTSARIITSIHNLEIELNAEFEDGHIKQTKWDLKRDALFKTVGQEIETYTFLLHLFSQKSFTVFFKDHIHFTSRCPRQEDYIREAKQMLAYFKGLKRIEQTFGVRFKDFQDIDADAWETMTKLLSIIDGKKIRRKDTISLTLKEMDQPMSDYLQKLNESEEGWLMEFVFDNTSRFILHGIELAVPGYRVAIERPIADNLLDYQNGKTDQITISSRTGNIWEIFSLTPLKPDQIIKCQFTEKIL